MARIVLRILLALVLIINLIIIIISYVTNVNVYKEYGMQILKVAGILALSIIAFYIALGLVGIS